MLITPTEFTEFLLYIGVLSKDTQAFFNEGINVTHTSDPEQSQNKKDIDIVLATSLECFFNELSNDKMREMTLNIVRKFKENKLSSAHPKLVKLIIIYSKLKILPLYSKFFKWKNIVNKEKQIQRQASSQYFQEISDDFQNTPIERTGNCFPASLTKKNKPLSRSVANFIQRQEKYKKAQSQSIAKVMTNNEIEYTMLCTFNPQINHLNNLSTNCYMAEVNEKDPCLRLYEESKLRLTKKENSEKERDKTESLRKDSKMSRKAPVNPKLVKLYEDHKLMTVKKKNLKAKIDYENGCTYKPKIYHSQSNISNSKSRHNMSRSVSQSCIGGIENSLTRDKSFNMSSLGKSYIPNKGKKSIFDY